MRRLTLTLAALLVTAVALPAAADEDEIGRAILRELRLMRKEIQALRKELAAHKRTAVLRAVPGKRLWHGKLDKHPGGEHLKRAMELHKKAMKIVPGHHARPDHHKPGKHPRPMYFKMKLPEGHPKMQFDFDVKKMKHHKTEDGTIIIEIETKDGKRIRRVMKVDPRQLHEEDYRIERVYRHGKDHTRPTARKKSARKKSYEKKPSKKRSKKATRKKRDRVEQLLEELLDELEKRAKRRKQRHMEHF